MQQLKLGTVTYTEAQLLALLRTPVRGDASLILAYQLIAAKLNVVSGASDAAIGATIAAADQWLKAYGTLPLNVDSASAAGAEAVRLGGLLDAYNNGLSGTPHCN